MCAKRWLTRGVLLLLTLALTAADARSDAADADIYRLFLHDGGAIISYGEFARVGDRVVLSVPVGEVTEKPVLQVVSIPQASVDWERTERYADAVRARKYGETRGEADFAVLGARVVEAMNQIASTEDPARRLAMATEARQNLLRWPAQNFGYRAAEVRDLAAMLDEVISDLRLAAGASTRVDLVANTVPPVEPLLAPPDVRETVEQALAVAPLVPEPSERISLLESIQSVLADPANRSSWTESVAPKVAAELAAERRVEQEYRTLATTTLAAARTRAARGELRGVQALFEEVMKADDRLGRRRPQSTSALLGALEWQLGEAVRVRQERELRARRRAAFVLYRDAIARPVQQVRDEKKRLLAIRERSGPSALLLPHLEQRLVMARQMLGVIVPPPELDAAHGLFRAALQMAARAVTAKRNAISFNDQKLDWEAASAAAGALMMLDRASEELARLIPAPAHR